ncbi:Hypothetical predicted protein [Lecanosticta acicola]|uniref:Uncharacterized protein n=1 Tax=Lecanosticta acicola TaxID=111012 RepID=A0AAI8YV90_9PEZI|nr:Hypothetical predicted protein [Lecanosticta acicola]
MAFHSSDLAKLADDFAHFVDGYRGITDDLDDLTDRLSGRQGLEGTDLNAARTVAPNSRHHEVRIVYPALELVPVDHGIKLSLCYPKDVEFRQEPRPNDFQLQADNLDFYVKLPTADVQSQARIPSGPSKQAADLPNTGLGAKRIVEMMNLLHEAPGVSTLEVVAYSQNGGTPRLITRLTTSWLTSQGRSSQKVRHLECDYPEWLDFMSSNLNVLWIKVIFDAMHRCSDRSFLAVHQKLHKFDTYHLIPQDQAEFGHLWSSRSIASANEVLLQCFALISPVIEDDRRLDWARTLCGCYVKVNREHLGRLSEEACKTYTCDRCGEPIMQKRHIRRIAIMHDLKERDQYKIQEQWWQYLNAAIPSGHQPVQVSPLALRDILSETLSSFRVPRSVMPPEFSPVNLPETKIVLNGLANVLQNPSIPAIASVSYPDTCYQLAPVAVGALMCSTGVSSETELTAVLPPKYLQFLDVWFTRAVKLLVARTNPSLAVQAPATRSVEEILSSMDD